MIPPFISKPLIKAHRVNPCTLARLTTVTMLNKVQTLNLVTCSICTAAASRQGCAGALVTQEAAGLLDETGCISGTPMVY